MLYSDLFHQTLHELTTQRKPWNAGSNSALDIQILIEKSFGISREQFWASKHKPVDDKSGLRTFQRYADRLKNHEPLAYILREKPFYNTHFYIDRNVLIPRPETELLVETALNIIDSPVRIMDIGAGSGNISVTLARETGSAVVAVEQDPKAIQVLHRNINIHRVKTRVKVERSDLFPRKIMIFDMIVSNPPYVSESEWDSLPPSVRNYEPRKALVAGKSGYEVIRQIITGAPAYLASGGWILIEIGCGQKAEVQKLLEKADLHNIHFKDDIGKIPRLACAQK